MPIGASGRRHAANSPLETLPFIVYRRFTMKVLSDISDVDVRCPEQRLAVALAALSHPARLAILRSLSARCCCCGEVVGELNLAQSTVSQHLKVLVAAGLVEMKPDRQRSLYRIDRKALSAAAEGLSAFADACGAGPAARRCGPSDD
jgi:DNA-binding transcriptional ArsR family regulator